MQATLLVTIEFCASKYAMQERLTMVTFYS
jgi:hypothetical protein